jgi:queuine tRNA-ribosyltransferase
MTASFDFRITHRSDGARRGVLATAHGRVETPAFMPVGTRGVVKATTPAQLREAGAEIVLANTYHLLVRPGDELIARRGGLHRFMAWDGPILTDSGGFQVFSLAARRTISDEGVVFRSHLDGALHALTPERAVDVQARLGSDIAMVLDECIAYPAPEDVARSAVRRTIGWARRARARARAIAEGGDPGVTVTNGRQAQFGIVQGGIYPDLRRESVEETVAIGFESYAIGGLGVGEPREVMYEIAGRTAALLPDERLRYLMGAGTPADLIECVGRGIDLFDCVLPTRNARNGQLFTSEGPLVIKNARYIEDDRPPDPACSCYTCRHFSRAYLRHLFLAGEATAATLNTLHNLHFYLDTMRRIRDAIAFGRFERFRQAFHQQLSRRPQS